MTTGYRLDTLLLCSLRDRRAVDRLALLLTDSGQRVEVQPFTPGAQPARAMAAALRAAGERAPLVLLAVSAALRAALAEGLGGELAEGAAAGRWRVLWLEEGEIEELPAPVEVIAWPRQGHGKQRTQQREEALLRLVGLAGGIGSSPIPAAPQGQAPKGARDEFPEWVKLALLLRVGGLCSRPGCGQFTIGPHSEPDKAVKNGAAAHITAAAPGGPRYNPALSSRERKSANNGIWLCENCHKLIDSDDPAYPESLLRQWKASAEQLQRDRQLGHPRGRSDWAGLGGEIAPPTSTPHNLPAPPSGPAELVGRSEALESLAQLLAGNGGPVVITGMDGVGKSALALHHLRQELDHYQGGVVMLDGRQPVAGLVEELEQFALVHFDLAVPDPLASLARLGWLYSHWPRTQSVLLLVDELLDPAALDVLGKGLPPRFRLLVTSSRKFGVASQRVPLEPLSTTAAVMLLEQLAERGRFRAAERRQAEALAAEVGGLPLALLLLGRRLARDPDLELGELLQTLQQRGALARELQGSTADPLQARGLGAGFQVIWAGLGPLERRLGLLLAELPPTAVPWELLARCCPPQIDPHDWQEARLALEQQHLIERPFARLLQMHPLLHDLFAAQAGEPEAAEFRTPLADALVPWLAGISDVLEARSRERQQRCLPLLEGLAQWPTARWRGVAVAWPHLARGRLLSGLGAHGPAKEALQTALELLRESTAGPGKAALEAGCRVALAGIARDRGKLQEAEAQCRQALAGLEAVDAVEAVEGAGADPVSALALERAEALNGLGLALLAQDQPEADEPLRQALELRLQQLDGGDRLVQISRTNLAMSLRRQGRAPEAKELYQQVLTTLEDDTCEVAVTARNNLSFLAEDAGDLERAYALRQEAVALAALALGEEHPNRGVMLMNLGAVAEQLGRLAEAEDDYRQAARLTSAAWGPDHPLSHQAQETLEAFLTSDATQA